MLSVSITGRNEPNPNHAMKLISITTRQSAERLYASPVHVPRIMEALNVIPDIVTYFACSEDEQRRIEAKYGSAWPKSSMQLEYERKWVTALKCTTRITGVVYDACVETDGWSQPHGGVAILVQLWKGKTQLYEARFITSGLSNGRIHVDLRDWRWTKEIVPHPVE
jgi:hypothetical protein